MTNYCYNAFGEVPREGERRARRRSSRVALPPHDPRDAAPMALTQYVRPEPVIHFFRYDGPMYRFREAVRELCSANRRRASETRRAQELLAWARAAGTLGTTLGHFVDLDRISPPPDDHAPEGFVDRCERLKEVADDEELLLNPLPRANPRVHRMVGRRARAVRDMMRGSALRDELQELARNTGDSQIAQMWLALALIRLTTITELALAEVEATQEQHNLAVDLQAVIDRDEDHLLKTLKGYVSNTSKGFKLVSHAIAVVARARILDVVNNATEANRLGRAAITYWASWVDGLDADDIAARLRSGDRETVEGVRTQIRRASPSSGRGLAKIAKSLGYVQAFFVIARFATGENATTGLSGIQDALSTGAAFNTLGQGTFTLLGEAGPLTTSGVGVARLFTATAAVLKTVGTGLSVASAVVSIVSGLDSISTGWRGGTNIDLYRVGEGALQVSAGVCVIVGVLCSNPASAAAGVLLGLVAVGVSAARPDDPLAKQIMESLCEEIVGRRTMADALGIHVVSVEQLLNYARGVDSQNRGMDRYWDYWSVRTSHMQSTTAGVHSAVCNGWRIVLTEAGLTEEQARRIITVS